MTRPTGPKEIVRGFTRRLGLRRAPDPEAFADAQHTKWEGLWEQEAARPESELSEIVPTELKEAVADRWIPPDAEVMDVGSGRGQISAWLATQGYAVVGAELAEAGTELARQHFGHLSDRLEFATVDICRDTPTPNRFDALVDRGCFHTLKVPLRGAYVENVAGWARPGAAFLLLAKIVNEVDGSQDLDLRNRASDREVGELFEPYFLVERSAPTREPMMRSAGEIPRLERPGRAYWMRRRDNGPS